MNSDYDRRDRYSRIPPETILERLDTGLRAVALERRGLPSIDAALQWDYDQGNKPDINRSSAYHLVNKLADPEDFRPPFEQHLGRIGIFPAVIVEGVVHYGEDKQLTLPSENPTI